MKKFFLMLLAVVGISVAAMADNDVPVVNGSGSCKISGAAYETVQAVVTYVDGNKVYFTLTTEYGKPVNAQVRVTADTKDCSSTTCTAESGGAAPGNGVESRAYSVTFDSEVTKVWGIQVTSAACN